MNWILLVWVAFSPSPAVHETFTFEECKARAQRHVENNNAVNPKALCIQRNGKAVVQIEPNKETRKK